MKNLFLIFGIFFALTQNVKANNETDQELIKNFFDFTGEYEENIQRLRQKLLTDLTEEEKKSVVGFELEREINPKYVERYEKDSGEKYSPKDEPNPWLAVYYDPEYFIEYLEKIPARTLAQKYQILVLWQIYKPEKVNSEAYKKIAAAAHNKTMEYLADNGNWQASWRREEYKEIVQDDFQKCYADINCLLKAIPYWMDLRIPMPVILPCDFAREHNRVYYFDGAAGGSGAQTILISTCIVDEKYNFAPDLNAYMGSMLFETMPFGDGSIMHFYRAANEAHHLDIIYRPDFNTDKIADWREFPYTKWAVASYYNFKKFNEALNKSVGYKKAVELLKEHYAKTFSVTPEQALNAALIALNPPSSDFFKRITPDNLNYLLLTGASWEKIEKHLPQNSDLSELLELSIAYPQNLKQLIKRAKNVDKPNSFGKTPLQTAAQYGYLESVKILLDAGADINHQTDDSDCISEYHIECIHNGKRTALMYALQEDNFEVAQYLLDNNANITLTDSQENIALDYLIKRAPQYSTHSTRGIYNGAVMRKVPEDHKKLPPQQYEQLHKRLFFNEQSHLADVLAGTWNTGQKNESTSFRKGTEPDAPLLTIENYNGVFAVCYARKDSHNVFSCKASKSMLNFDAYFAITHYYKDYLQIYFSLELDYLDQCLQNALCLPDLLGALERESEHD